jgi:hypothetical protein
VEYIVTEASDFRVAEFMGINYSPKLVRGRGSGGDQEAAARIFLARPSLSHHIRQLEKELGARLFERGPARVSLTLAGETLLPDARARDPVTNPAGTAGGSRRSTRCGRRRGPRSRPPTPGVREVLLLDAHALRACPARPDR